jgi:hypothetical protein
MYTVKDEFSKLMPLCEIGGSSTCRDLFDLLARDLGPLHLPPPANQGRSEQNRPIRLRFICEFLIFWRGVRSLTTFSLPLKFYFLLLSSEMGPTA